mmetsp:Transcript_8851/g.26589  ORF Transcript_8851/g.26589 Transcript_8851/m.26589 type:complete len:244 (+) Transcript_8851:176-907(+)
MEVKLSVALGWLAESDAGSMSDDIIVLDQAICRGSFLLLELLRLLVLAERPCIVVSTERLPRHYLAMLRKLGCSMTNAKAKLSFISCLDDETSTREEPADSVESRLDSAALVHKVTRCGADVLNLYETIARTGEEMCGACSRSYVVIDNLSTLGQQVGGRAVCALVAALKRNDVPFCALVHADIETAELVREMSFFAHTLAVVEPLLTGTSQDFDGKCKLTSPKGTSDCLFKVHDQQIVLYQR